MATHRFHFFRGINLLVGLVLILSPLPSYPGSAISPDSVPSHTVAPITADNLRTIQDDGESPVEYFGSFGGVITSLKIRDTFAYIGAGVAFIILDLSNPNLPVIHSSLTMRGTIMGVDVSGNFAYVALRLYDPAQEEGWHKWCLQIIDVTDPAHPTLRGTYYGEFDEFVSLQIVDNLVYARSLSGFQIIDVTDATHPRIRGEYSGFVSSMQVVGNLAYVYDGHRYYGYGGYVLVDVSDPAKPIIRSTHDGLGGCQFQVKNDIIYEIQGNKLGDTWLTLRDASTMAAIGFYKPSSTGWIGGFQLVDNLLYIFVSGDDEGSRIEIIDVSNPSNLLLLGSYEAVAGPSAAEGNYVYIVSSDYQRSALEIIDVSSSTNPTLAGEFLYPRIDCYTFRVKENFAYSIDDEYEFNIYDLSNPTYPTLLGHLNTPGWAFNLDVVSNFAYIYYLQTGGIWGLQIIDVSNPISPTLRGNYDLGVDHTENQIGNTLKVVNNRAFVSLGDKGVQIIDVSDPFSPTFIAHFDTSTYVMEIEVVDDLAYVIEISSELQIFDVRNPSLPVLLSSYGTRQEAYSVEVVNNLVYVAFDSGLDIIDVSDPSHPFLCGSYSSKYTTGRYGRVVVANDFAYLLGDSLLIIDISSSANPTRRGTVLYPYYPKDIQIVNDLVYVMGDWGVEILRIYPERFPLPSVVSYLPLVHR